MIIGDGFTYVVTKDVLQDDGAPFIVWELKLDHRRVWDVTAKLMSPENEVTGTIRMAHGVCRDCPIEKCPGFEKFKHFVKIAGTLETAWELLSMAQSIGCLKPRSE